MARLFWATLIVFLSAAHAVAGGTQLVNLPLTSSLTDTKGNLTAGNLVRNSDATYVSTSGQLAYSRGTRQNILLYSESTANWSGSGPWTQSVNVTAGTTYLVSVHKSGPTVTVTAGTATITHTSGSTSATYGSSDYFTCTASGTVTVTTDTADPKAMIEQLPSGNVIGSNTVTNGGFDSDTSWTKGTDWTISGGVANKTAGTASDLYQATSYPSGETVQVVFTLTRTAGTLTPKLGSASGQAFSSGGTYTVYIRTAASSPNLIFSADSSFAGTIDNVTAKSVPDLAYLQPGIYTPTSGSTETIPAEPRFETNGLLVEGEATNYIMSSNTFSAGTALIIRSSIANDSVLKLDGSYGTANTLKEDGSASNTHYLSYVLTSNHLAQPPTDTLTFSIVLKNPEVNGRRWVLLMLTTSAGGPRGSYFDLQEGALGSTTATPPTSRGIRSLGNGWYRCWVSHSGLGYGGGLTAQVQLAQSDGVSSYNGDNTSKIHLDHAQVETGLFPTSIIPTNGCPVTRLSEAGSSTNGYSWLMSTALKAAATDSGTMLIDFTPGHAAAGGSGTGSGIVSLTNAATSFLYYDYTNTNFEATDGTNTAVNNESIANGTTYTVAVRWDQDANSGNGYFKVSEKHGGTWTHGTSVDFNDAYAAGDYLRLAYGNGYPFWIKNIRIFDGWVKDANLDVPVLSDWAIPGKPWSEFTIVKPYEY